MPLTTIRRARPIVLGLSAVWLTSVAAQSPVFRTGVDLVTVDATVVGSGGQVLDRLGANDFRLTVDGQPRRVVSALFVSLDSTAAPRARPPVEYFTSNQDVDEGRLVVVAVDEAHIRRLEGGQALRAAGDFIDRLDPRDRIAVAGLTRTSTLEFTRDRVALKRRLAGLVGQGDQVFLQFNIGLSEATEIADGSRAKLADVVQRECGRALTTYLNPARAADEVNVRDACPEQVEQEARAMAQYARAQARISVSALEGLVDGLKDIEGPKTLVLLSEGMVAEPRYIDFTELAATAQAARVSIYVLHLETPIFEASQTRVSPTFVTDIAVRGDGLARLAGAARGAVFRLVGSDPQPFDRIRRELAGYYLLAFEPLASDRDGNVHRIRVSLARGGGNLRAREAFRLPAPVSSERAREMELVALLRQARPARELPVKVATYLYAEPSAAGLRVVVSTEADAPEGAVLGYVLIDQRGTIVSSAAHRTDSGRHAFSAMLAPGEYSLRVGAIDHMGRRGSLERPFAAALRQFGAVRISDVIVAPQPPDPSARLDPIVDRLDRGAAVVNVELYADEGGALDDTAIDVEIVRDGSRQVLLERRADLIRRDARWAVGRATLALQRFPPGPYVVRVRLIVGGGAPVVAERSFTLR